MSSSQFNSSKSPVILEQRSNGSFSDAVLDAIPDQLAVLDRDGVIVYVNEAWRRFARANGGDPDSMGVGQSYLDVCSPPVEDEGAASPELDLAKEIGAVLSGQARVLEHEYPCHTPSSLRWFAMRAKSLPGGGAVIIHSNITRRKLAEEELAEAAMLDPLTKLLNRRGLMARVSLRASTHTGSSLLLVDIDDFKKVNDTCGYTAGDELLSSVAGLLRSSLRPDDIVARIGGDEFLAVLPVTSVDLAANVAERFRSALQDLPGVGAAPNIRTSVSISVASCRLPVDSVQSLVEVAQSGLAEGKRAGKNRVIKMSETE